MQTIHEHIVAKQTEFKKHAFFTKLANTHTGSAIRVFAPQLTFWVMVFQDILRINTKAIKDPYLRKIARHHEIEDSGHDRWFLEDLKHIASENFASFDISWLFNKANVVTRDAAYALLAETIKLEDEHLRIILLLTLESSGHIFFERVAKHVEAIGYHSYLKYFSSTHLEVEQAHAVFEEEMERELFKIQLSPERQAQGISLVNRLYTCFTAMFDDLVYCFNQPETLASAEAELLA